MRQALCELLRQDPRCEVISNGADCSNGVAMAREHLPEIAIVDCDPPSTDEQHYACGIRGVAPAIYIAMFTLRKNKHSIASTLNAGCKAYFSKTEGGDVWRDAISHALRGEPFFSADVKEFLVAHMLDTSAAPARQLTSRQQQVMQQIAEGRKNIDIAKTLGLSVKTVEAHRLEVMKRLDVRNVADLVRHAIRNDVIEP